MSNLLSKNTKLQQLIDSLNESQKVAVINNEKFLQIIAGPGSGKTRVLTCRVAYMILEKNIDPSNIVVVTYTRKAMEELKERLTTLVGLYKTERLLVNTFHGLCLALVKKHAQLLGYEYNIQVISGRARTTIMRKIINDESILTRHQDRNINAGAVFEEIDNALNRGENCILYENLYSGCESNIKRITTILFTAYEQELKKDNLIDLNSIVIKACELLKLKKDALHDVKAVLVDEFQDTSFTQYKLLKSILNQDGERSLTVVGDPDQSIYGWRSAKEKIFELMTKDLKKGENNVKTIYLTENFRSTAIIVSVADCVLRQDYERAQKESFTSNPRGIPIILLTTLNEKSQGLLVAKEIKKAVEGSRGLLEYKDIAILMRANHSSEQFERVLRVYEIPFVYKKEKHFFAREEVQNALAYLKLVVKPWDTSSFKRAISAPERFLKHSTLNFLEELTVQQTNNYIESAKLFVANYQRRLFHPDRSTLKRFADLFQSIRAMIDREADVSEILLFIFEETNYYQHLKQVSFRDHTLKWKNMDELVSISKTRTEFVAQKRKTDFPPSSQYYEEYSADAGYANNEDEVALPGKDFYVRDFIKFCDDCLVESRKVQVSGKGGCVTISSIHSAKGLEWPCVFLVTCVDGVMPMHTQNRSEERRLLYVAMTRSKFLLYCISPIEVSFGEDIEIPGASPFLMGIENSLKSYQSPVWDHDMRIMLAATLDRPLPQDENASRTSNTSSQHTTSPKNEENITVKNEEFTFYQPFSSSTAQNQLSRVTTVASYSVNNSSPPNQRKRPVDSDQNDNYTHIKKEKK